MIAIISQHPLVRVAVSPQATMVKKSTKQLRYLQGKRRRESVNKSCRFRKAKSAEKGRQTLIIKGITRSKINKAERYLVKTSHKSSQWWFPQKKHAPLLHSLILNSLVLMMLQSMTTYSPLPYNNISTLALYHSSFNTTRKDQKAVGLAGKLKIKLTTKIIKMKIINIISSVCRQLPVNCTQ